jgi:hypothetical protein
METEPPSLQTLRDAIARQVIRISKRSGAIGDNTDAAEDLDDFVSFLALELWPVLPRLLQEATYESRETVPSADDVSLDTLSTSFVDTLTSYGLCDDEDNVTRLVRFVLEDYISEACAPPPVWSSTRTAECEMCERAVPLSYHHLIPRSTHAKVLKRKWHPESQLNSVAWLCRWVSLFPSLCSRR